MKSLFVTCFFLMVLSSCNEGQKNHETEETLPTNRLDAITASDYDTSVVNDSASKD